MASEPNTYEYRVISLSNDNADHGDMTARVEAAMNELGADGWAVFQAQLDAWQATLFARRVRRKGGAA